MDERKCEELVALLAKKSLHYIEVIPFDSDDDEEDEDDGEDYDDDDDDEEEEE